MPEQQARRQRQRNDAERIGRQFPLPANAWELLPLFAFLGFAALGWWPGLDPNAQDLTDRLQPPVGWGGTWEHAAGTDSLGRDLLARAIVGAQLSLTIGLVVAVLAAVIGVGLGVWAGIGGRLADDFVTALGEVTLAIPTIVVGLVVAATLGQGMINLISLLVLSAWITQARVLRLQARRVMQSDFVIASIALGAGRRHVAVRHVIPNVIPQIVVVFCQQVAGVMIWESSLTYLGIGLPIERISLGGLIRDGQQHLFDAPWLGIFPGLILAWAILAFTIVAGWIQAYLEPGGA